MPSTLSLLALLSLLQATPTAMHPLDPLTAEEIQAAVAVVRADARMREAAFPLVALAEPEKGAVLAWPGRPVPRQARVQAMTRDRFYEVVVDLATRRLAAVTDRTGSEPSIMLSEIEAVGIVLKDPAFTAALARRGITDLTKLFCAPFTAGYYGEGDGEPRRLARVGCFDTRRSTTNVFGWPIERLYALVDLRRREVRSVSDGGVVPVSPADLNYDGAPAGPARPARKPTRQAQPDGRNVAVDGHVVRWGPWRLHVRLDPRVGTVVSQASWDGGSGPRSVLYQGYLSEMFVPYMDPADGWQSRTYFDTGEYGAGALATTLEPGIDCPETAIFQPAVFATDKGEPFTTPNAVCVFERSTGDPIWRHREFINQTFEGRANVDLVVRMAATIGNYDYLFDWVFTDAGEVEIRVGATGIDALKGVATTRMADATAAADTRYGTLVAPNLVAVHHDHYFNFRLDLDVDAPANSFHREVYRAETLPAGSPRRSLYVVEPKIAATEGDARMHLHEGPHKLRIVNEAKTNGVGNPVSYEIVAANHARLLLDRNDWPARRARFLEHDVWVTPYVPAERYAAGEYMVGSKGDDGLPAWTARNRAIRNQDIVVWVNVGMHHLTRAEDVPVMPTLWHSLRLRPFNFFDRNPAIDLPKEPRAPAQTP